MGTKTPAKKKARKLYKTIKKTVKAKRPATQPTAWLHRHWKVPVILIGCILLISVVVHLVLQLTPWPKVLLIRYAFDKGGAKTQQALEKYVPSDIITTGHQQYRSHDKDAVLTAFYPYAAEQEKKALPTVVWVHGGAWISGSTDRISNYLKIIAGRGYTVVGVDYSLAPSKTYPTQITQVNDALRYVQEHADELHVDPTHIVLAGDSAGSQIAAQVAALTTEPEYAKKLNMQPGMPAANLKAMVLNCGAYDLVLADYDGPAGDFLRTVLWSYSGTSHFLSDPKLALASVAHYVNGNFPPSFITAGNADPLEPQSRELAANLTKAGVVNDTLFYPKDYQPALPHEYQFNLDSSEGRTALEHITNFLAAHTQ